MPSRKRSQGKNRKEKNEARGPVERDVIEEWEYICRWGEQADNIRCNHGCMMPPRGHAVHNFMKTFEEGTLRNFSGIGGIKLAFEKHLEVLKDPVTRKMAMDIFLSTGTNFILRGGVNDARATTGPIIYLEHYNDEDQIGPALSSAIEKIGYMCVDIDESREKDTIHFYKTRILCSCLKERYSRVKKLHSSMIDMKSLIFLHNLKISPQKTTTTLRLFVGIDPPRVDIIFPLLDFTCPKVMQLRNEA